MSWSVLTLSTPVSDAANVSQNLSVFSVTPWTYGTGEGNGNYTWLSFPNAIDALINKITLQPSLAVFAMAVSASNASDLSNQIDLLTAAMPLKQFLQWKRHASKLVTLENEKLNLITPVTDTNDFSINAIPEIKQRMIKDSSVLALATASDIAASDPLTNLSAFEASKTAHDAIVNTPLPDLNGGAGWRFYADTDIANALRSGHPGHEYTMTALLAFLGTPADLAYLTELMP